ncbi:rab effector Noc2 isoform X1 [Alexandromys fortis]|uniref:rab effector Noc2 isoform X1 n=1 Tax=Alexandromys fortis TaxID=100897 RepID=UPI0021537DF2|nr:rab effector Noc2 isoform X1 [Microtus fortis]XP_049984811.1 rab effector Noc2 isoform X1 [Microtus fortis]XP_049984812.1 rab effector Noc2 isoform X1 [Microtus fortis]XP_049984813.1 rab effector Noc2 isoform X1 [Microtus fortis]
MADTIFSSGNDQWVCPNDRQLALRAKLQTGWSVHTYQTEKQRRNQCLSPAELEVILQVIQRAERLDILEQQRIGRLVERLETMQRNVLGNGLSQCLLCGEVLGFLGSASVFCKDCRKKVCTKCGIEASPSPGQKRPLWLCKICSEQREVWKRSGAWFYKGLPKYILPLKTPGRADDPHFRPLPVEPTEPQPQSAEATRVYTWARGRVVSSDSDSDLSSSSLEDSAMPTAVKGTKGDNPRGDSGGVMESPRIGPACPPSRLSGSQSSLASEAGTSAPDPQGGTPPRPEPRVPGKRHTWTTSRC